MVCALFDLALDRGLTLMGIPAEAPGRKLATSANPQHRDIFSDKLSPDAEFFVCS